MSNINCARPSTIITTGSDFNYIVDCKSQLIQRENTLMNKKIERIHDVINYSINKTAHNFNFNKYPINPINKYIEQINKLLSSWNGLSQHHQAFKDLSKYSNYFKESRRWFDIKKQKSKSYFWIPLFDIINQFTAAITMTYFVNNDNYSKKYQQYLLCKFMLLLLQSTVTFSNTKPLPLISFSLLRDDAIIKKWLFKYLNMNIDSIISITNVGKKHKMSLQTVQLQVVHQLTKLTNSLKTELEYVQLQYISNMKDGMSLLWISSRSASTASSYINNQYQNTVINNVNSWQQHNQVIMAPNYSITKQCCACCCSCNQLNYLNQCRCNICTSNNADNRNLNQYGTYHTSSYNVSDHRHHPYNSYSYIRFPWY